MSDDLLDLGDAVAKRTRARLDATTFGSTEPGYVYGPVEAIQIFTRAGAITLSPGALMQLAVFAQG